MFIIVLEPNQTVNKFASVPTLLQSFAAIKITICLYLQNRIKLEIFSCTFVS